MQNWIYAHLAHFLCAMNLLGRLGDIISTRLITPKMHLEANLLMKRLGWRFAVVTTLVCFIPYLSIEMGIGFMVVSFLVSASNTSRIWLVRAVGEEAWATMVLQCAARTRLSAALACTWVSAGFLVLAGATLLLFTGGSGDAAWWFGIGIIVYAVAIGFHGTVWLTRTFRRGRLLYGSPQQAARLES